MSAFDPYAPEEAEFRRRFLIGSVALSVPLSALLVVYPEIDLALSTAFWEMCPAPGAGKPWCTVASVVAARQLFMGLFALVALISLAMTIRILIARGQWLGLDQARCLFMVSVLIVGPGVVANLVFKENLGRARPRDVVEFGGTKAFTPPLVPSRECARNCSFVSGEASSIYAAFFALALLLPPYRTALLIGGITAGSLAGLVRMIQGAHFLSDVLFAGIFMAMTVSVLHIIFIGLWREFNPRRIWHALDTFALQLIRARMSVARGRG